MAEAKVTVGVDTHKHLHVAVALSAQGARLGELTVGADPGGYEQLLAWARSLGAPWCFGVDADGDGVKDPFNPRDAIFAAGRLLRYLGAPENWHDAIYGYNHAEWYVEKVLRYAEEFSAEGDEAVATAGCTTIPAPNEAVAKILAEAERLHRLRPQSEYIYGGSHGVSPTPPNGPFDCSSAVSHLLQVAGYGNPTMDTIALMGWADPGPGRWVMIYDKPYGADAHTFFKFDPGLTPPTSATGALRATSPGTSARASSPNRPSPPPT